MPRHAAGESSKLARRPLDGGGLGPIGIAVLNLHFGLLLWIGIFFVVAQNDVSGIREAWRQEVFFGLSAFACCVVILIALFAVTLFDGLVLRRRSLATGYCIIGYGANVAFLAAVGWDFYFIQSRFLDDDWLAAAIESESIEPRYFFVGRILEHDSKGCRAETVSCVSVELDSGEVVSAELLDLSEQYPFEYRSYSLDSEGHWTSELKVAEEPEPSDIVYVDQMFGRFSGITYYQASFVDQPNPEMFWQSVIRQR